MQWYVWNHQPSGWGNPVWVFKFFSLSPNDNERCSHKYFLFKWCVYWKWWLLKLDLILCLCSPILLDNVFDYMTCLINTDVIFISVDVNIDYLYWWVLLEFLIKEGIKFLNWSLKVNHIMCCCDDIICFNSKKTIWIIVKSWEYRVARRNSDHLDCDKNKLY